MKDSAITNLVEQSNYGRDIWKKIVKNFHIGKSDLVLFCEMDISDMVNSIDDNIDKYTECDVFLISTKKEHKLSKATPIILCPYEYDSLKQYYLFTWCHRKVRFLSDKEPFGNMKIFHIYPSVEEEYIRKAVLKI